MNPNLHHVRALLGADLTNQVEQISRELQQESDDLVVWVDSKLLRGIPARGGVITDSLIPGSDEHLDQLDNVRRTA
jgi:hypothetical protein